MDYRLHLITSKFKFWLYNLFRENNKFLPKNLFEKRFNKTLKEKQNYQNSNEENSLSLKTEENNYSVKLSLTKPFHISGNSKTRPQSNYIETSARNIKNNTIENSQKKELNMIENNNISYSKTYLSYNMNIPFIQSNEYKNICNNNYIHDFNLDNGIIYKTKNGYEYLLYIPTFDLFMIKNVKSIYYQNIIEKINEWNNLNNNKNYLKIYKTIENKNEDDISILIEQPLGYTLNDIINSIGFFDNEMMKKIINKIILNIPNEINENNNQFCACDLIFDMNNKLKFIPPIIRNIHSSHKLCNCKITLLKLSKIFNIKINTFFCLGMIILKMISGNMKISSFKLLFLNYEKIKNESQCCLLHTLLYIENKFMDKNQFLLKDLLKLYPKDIVNFLCLCTSFYQTSIKNIIDHYWLIEKNNKYQRILLSFGEILNLVQNNYSENNFKTFDEFYNNFDKIYKKLNHKFTQNFKEKLINKKNEILFISKSYNIEKEVAVSKFINISNNIF